jgi:alpha-tubulin suppressor-like RCC1 family protein
MKTTILLVTRLGLAGLLFSGAAALTAHAGGKVAAWGDGSWQQTRLPAGLAEVRAIAAGAGHSVALKADGTVTAWDYHGVSGATNVPAGLSNVIAISAKSISSLALRGDGTVVGWGVSPTVPPVSSLSNITAIAAGWYHWVALKRDGTIVTAGVGNTSSNPAHPTNIPSGLSNLTAVAAGSEYTVVLKSDGTVTAWGFNAFGQTNVPPGLSNVVAIAAGYSHSLALKADGTVVSWGAVGNPVVPAGLSNVVAIAAGARHSLALRRDGTVVAWWAAHDGFPDLGQTTLPPGLTNVSVIAAGEAHNLALLPQGPPDILQHPVSAATVPQGEAVFTAVVTGNEPLHLQWRQNGTPMTNSARISGTTTASLIIAKVRFSDAGSYTLMASNALGWVVSSDALLTVNGPPQIVQQTPDQTVGAGTSVTLSVTAEGTPPLTYQWSSHGTNLPGRTTRLLYFPSAQPDVSGHYTVVVSNAFGTTAATCGLLVTNRAPVITIQSSLMATNLRTSVSSPVPSGSGVAITVSAAGSLPLRYQWRLDGVALPRATNAVLLLLNLTAAQSGYYAVEVANDYGATLSDPVRLDVFSGSQIVGAGLPMVGNTNLPPGLVGVTALSAGGSHGMALLADGTVRTWLANAGYVHGVAYAVTNIPASATNVIAIAAGSYHCLALRANGTVVAWGVPGALTSLPPGLANVVAIAAGSFSSYVVRADGTVTNWGGFSVPSSITNVVALAVADSHYAALRWDGTVAHRSSGGTLTPVVPGLSNAIAVAASASDCRALRADGTVVRWSPSSAAQPTLVAWGQQPVISNAVAIALGSGQVRMILRQDGSVVTEGFPAVAGAVPDTNNIAAIAAGGVQIGFGLLLVGDGRPAITLHPVSQIGLRGGVAKLHARAAGAQPLSFQWQRDGVNLPDATNASLTLSNLTVADRGTYQAMVSNHLGTVASRVAVLTVPATTNLAAALNATNLAWTTFSSGQPTTNGWFGQWLESHDLDAAGQSGAVSHGQRSVLQTAVTGPVTLSFWWKVSSEPERDFLRFYWNNMGTPYASLSGETDWQQVTLPLGVGTHTLRWAYAKDGSGSAGRDAGWLDEVQVTPRIEFTTHPRSHVLPAGTTVTLIGTAASPLPFSYQWLKDGMEIPGATNWYYMLRQMNRRHSGIYALRATNTAAAAFSSNAVVKVLVPQQLAGAQMLANGTFGVRSADADGGWLEAGDLPGFEAQASTNLLDWSVLPGALSVTNGWLWLRDTNAPQSPRRFYRIFEP